MKEYKPKAIRTLRKMVFDIKEHCAWGNETQDSEVEIDQTEDIAEKEFYEKYWELDSTSVRDYFAANSNLIQDGYDSILIEDLEGTLGLKTASDDSLLVLDTENNLMIIGVAGNQFVGKLAIVKNPEQVELIKASRFGSVGEMVWVS